MRLWSGKVRLAQLPPLLLALGGAMIALRGGWIFGVPAMALGLLGIAG